MGANKHKIPAKLTSGTVLPKKATPGAAGLDFVAIKREFFKVENGEFKNIEPTEARQFDLVRYRTGIFIELPEGCVALAFARSSIAKMPLIMANTTGVIDSDYRGEIMFMFRILNPENIVETAYQIGDRIGQLVIMKVEDAELIKTDELNSSHRGDGAYGSTGR
ncbi:MAG TPA: hypothetical protein VFT49_03060 [Candidatus Saccharimonadales bacterium]|nr:hypothetical protein [Candidatus Saccharimonadales bacterium]